METKKVYYPLLDNYRKIENIFGLDFVKKSENDELSVEDFLYANDRLSRRIYGETIASLIKKTGKWFPTKSTKTYEWIDNWAKSMVVVNYPFLPAPSAKS